MVKSTVFWTLKNNCFDFEYQLRRFLFKSLFLTSSVEAKHKLLKFQNHFQINGLFMNPVICIRKVPGNLFVL